MIRELIQNKKEKLKITNRFLATKIGVDPATISNFLKGKTDINFEAMLKVGSFLFSDNIHEAITHYFKSIKKKEYFRMGLEYSSIHSVKPLFEYLLDSQASSNNVENREWALVYQLVYERQYSKIKPEELINKARNMRVITDEMKIMCHMLEVFGYYEENNLKTMFDISRNLEEQILSLNNSYIKEMFLSRLSLAYANAYLRYRNDAKSSRSYALKVINNKNVGKRYVASGYHVLSMTYYFQSYDIALNYLNKAVSLYQEIGDKIGENVIVHNIDLLNNLWGKNLHTKVNSVEEKIHQEIKKGNFSFVKKEIAKLDSNSPFTKYYESFIIEDELQAKDALYEALELFISNGDRYYAENLVATELSRRNERDSAIRAACTI